MDVNLLILPIQNVLTATSVSLNQYLARCRGTMDITSPSSIYAYGGPIMLLIFQIFGLFGLLVWMDGSMFVKPRTVLGGHYKEGRGNSGRADVDEETMRVEGSKDDLLKTLHLFKTFGKAAHPAVDDVTIGLGQGEILVRPPSTLSG